MSRKQRRARRKARLINNIYVSIDFQDKRPDCVWITFNTPDPHPFKADCKPALLTTMFHVAYGKGEAYVSKHFPGITYKKTRQR